MTASIGGMTDGQGYENMTGEVLLRNMAETDLPIFFEQQLDPDANYMAAFTAKDPTDRAAYYTHWEKVCADARITIRTILYEGQVAGYVLCHPWFGVPEISYWLGREFWGKGIATAALAAFLHIVTVRPIYARAARDNYASLRVLEKCGFEVIDEERGFASARGAEIDEFVLKLLAPAEVTFP